MLSKISSQLIFTQHNRNYFNWSEDLDKLDPKGYFKDYDFWEEFDESKEYQNDIYEKEYQGKIKKYHNTLYTLKDKFNNKEKQYVIVEEEYDIDELQSLIKFCPCKCCQMYWCNIIKLALPEVEIKHDEFNAHVTIGQFKNSEVETKLKEYQEWLEQNPIKFTVNQIYILQRSKTDNNLPFEIYDTITI